MTSNPYKATTIPVSTGYIIAQQSVITGIYIKNKLGGKPGSQAVQAKE